MVVPRRIRLRPQFMITTKVLVGLVGPATVDISAVNHIYINGLDLVFALSLAWPGLFRLQFSNSPGLTLYTYLCCTIARVV